MKQVNFITSLSPQKQYAIRRWFWATSCLCMIAIAVSLYLIVPQLFVYRALRKEVNLLRAATKDYATAVKNKDALKEEHNAVRVRTKKIDNYNTSPKNPHQHIAAIIQASGNGVTLESIRFNKNNCELTLLCPTSEHATVFIKRLSASELFTGVKLVSLQYEEKTKQFRCVVKSVMHKV